MQDATQFLGTKGFRMKKESDIQIRHSFTDETGKVRSKDSEIIRVGKRVGVYDGGKKSRGRDRQSRVKQTEPVVPHAIQRASSDQTRRDLIYRSGTSVVFRTAPMIPQAAAADGGALSSDSEQRPKFGIVRKIFDSSTKKDVSFGSVAEGKGVQLQKNVTVVVSPLKPVTEEGSGASRIQFVADTRHDEIFVLGNQAYVVPELARQGKGGTYGILRTDLDNIHSFLQQQWVCTERVQATFHWQQITRKRKPRVARGDPNDTSAATTSRPRRTTEATTASAIAVTEPEDEDKRLRRRENEDQNRGRRLHERNAKAAASLNPPVKQ